MKNFVTFLDHNNLLQLNPKTAAKQLLARKNKIKKNIIKRILVTYLFFRVPLFHPDKFLDKTMPFVKIFFSKIFYIILTLIGILSLYLVSRQWEQFVHTFWYFFNWEGLIYFIIVVLVSKVLHELGHAYTAKYFGTRVTTIGFALIVFWPIMYTDTTDAWRLTSRHQRMAIDAAGMIVEIMLAVFATFLWVLLPDGPLRSAMFFIATVSWIFSLLVNLNPCIRFDGYYLFADWLNVSNLRQRAFALGKWRLREWLLGLNEPKPQQFAKKTERIVTIYCYATWIYRLFLFSTIAVIIYYVFFKLLGLILAGLIIGTLLVAPIMKELHEYWKRREGITLNKNVIITCTVIIVALFLLIYPWRSSIHAPALLTFGKETKIFAPEGSRIINIHVKENQHVNKDQLLLILNSPGLDHKIQQTTYDTHILKNRIRAELAQSERLGFRQADEEELATKQSELHTLLAQQEDLTIKAPFAGKVSYVAKGLKQNHWVTKNAYLLEIVNNSTQQIRAYIPEKDIERFNVNALTTFYPNEPNLSKISAKIVDIEKANTKELTEPYLASLYGGDIAVEQDRDKKLVLKDSVYRITLQPENKVDNYQHATAGMINLTSEPESLLYRAWVKINAIFVRESGF